MTTDPLAAWWVHAIVIERWTGTSGYGADTFADPEPVNGFVNDGTKLVVGPNGQTVTSSAQVALPIGTSYVPVKSKVTFPAEFGHASGDPDSPRQSTVIAASRADAGNQPVPAHYELALQ